MGAEAQIKVHSNGKVSIRSSTISSYDDIYLNGRTDINGALYFSADNVRLLEITKYYENPLIVPYQTNRGYIGSTARMFSEIHVKKHYGQTYYCDGTPFQGSDLKLKENIKEIESPLQTIMLLNGKKYDFKIDSTDLNGNKEEVERNISVKKNKYGFIAQDVEKILPEVTHYNKENEILYLDYTSFIPIIVEALKEQQKLIVDLQKEIKQLKDKPIIKSANTGNKTENNETITTATLAQNIPNPFSNSTRIDIYLPQNASNAVLYVYNMQGVQIKSYTINERESTSIIIEGYSLQAGMYLYTLIADGKEVDTKKMILTK